MVKFQMVGSDSPNTIACVRDDVDVESFRRDTGWFEIKEEKEVETVAVVAEEVKVRKPRVSKKELAE